MSLESAHAFWKRVKTDAQFRDRLQAATSEHDLSHLIISSGFTVTAEELKTSMADWNATNTASRELSDHELEAVAGGSLLFVPDGTLSVVDLKKNVAVVARTGKGG